MAQDGPVRFGILVALDTGRSVATLPTGHAPHEVAVSADGRTAVVANYGDRERSGDSLTVVDLRARKVARTIDLGEHRRPHGLTFVARSMVAVSTSTALASRLVDWSR